MRKVWILVAVAALYGASLGTNAVAVHLFPDIPGEPVEFNGMSALITSFNGPVTGSFPLTVALLVNVFLLIAWLAYAASRQRVARLCSILAVVCSIATPILLDMSVDRLRMGYWLWVASCFVILLATTLTGRQKGIQVPA